MNILEYNELLKMPSGGTIITDSDGKTTINVGGYEVVWDKVNPQTLSYSSMKKIKKINLDKSTERTNIYRNLADLAEPYLRGKHNGSYVSFRFRGGTRRIDMVVFHGYIIPTQAFDEITSYFAKIERTYDVNRFENNSAIEIAGAIRFSSYPEDEEVTCYEP